MKPHIYTFGDSVLDCGRYSNDVLPANIVAEALGGKVTHRAVDGATSRDLASQD